MNTRNLERIDAVVVSILRAARVPGAAVAVVCGDGSVLTRGYGYRDVGARHSVNAETSYPIASTTKPITSTLLGMLVEDGRLAWDAPVQRYLPRFRLGDAIISSRVTVRDLLSMRTGLPRHDFVWMENHISRSDLVECLAHLPLSADFRERFQYNNLTFTLAAHIAEVVTQQSWEQLIRSKVFEPLGMGNTGFLRPSTDNVTLGYHENDARELVSTSLFDATVIGPAGGTIYSTIDDMARWVSFNINEGVVGERRLIQLQTLREIQSPCIMMGAETVAPSPNAAYGLGWFVDTYNGRNRVSHTGVLHDVQSCVTIFPQDGIGIVSFTNFAPARIAPLLNQHVLDALSNLTPTQTVSAVMEEYERKVQEARQRNAAVNRIDGASPSHGLNDYAGTYLHGGYGKIEIRRQESRLFFVRNNFALPLEHWHYDAWVIVKNDLFEIHRPHAFERSSRILFETSPAGEICAFSIQLESAVDRIRFVRV